MKLTNFMGFSVSPGWRPTEWTQPVLTEERELRPLGVDRAGCEWFTIGRHGEFYERIELVHESKVPDGPIVLAEEDDDGQWFRVFEGPFRPGTFEERTAARERRERRERRPAARAIDAVGATSYGRRGRERITMAPRPAVDDGVRPRGFADMERVTAVTIPAPGPARGAAEIIARLRRHRVEVRLAADREHLVLLAPRGRADPNAAELAAIAAPLLVAHLRGEPLACAVGRGCKHPAATIAAGGAPWCGVCEPK